MHTSRIVGLLLLVIVQNMHSSLTPRPGSSKNTGSVPVPTAIKIKKPPDEAGWFVNFGGGGGNRPSWPAIALASAMSFAGSPHAARIPRSPRAQVRRKTRVRFPSQLRSKLKNHPMKLGGLLILVEAAGIEPASRSTLQTVLHT